MKNERLESRVREARTIISHQRVEDDRGILMIKASVFRCFLGVLEKDARLIKDDLGANIVWESHLLEAGFSEGGSK